MHQFLGPVATAVVSLLPRSSDLVALLAADAQSDSQHTFYTPDRRHTCMVSAAKGVVSFHVEFSIGGTGVYIREDYREQWLEISVALFAGDRACEIFRQVQTGELRRLSDIGAMFGEMATLGDLDISEVNLHAETDTPMIVAKQIHSLSHQIVEAHLSSLTSKD